MNNKAQGLSMNVIIVAAIALLVLVVIVAIFSGRMGIFNRDLTDQAKNECTSKGGECLDTCGDGYVQSFGMTCEGAGKICCMKVSG